MKITESMSKYIAFSRSRSDVPTDMFALLLKKIVEEVKTDTGLFLDVLFLLPFLNKCLVIAYFKPSEKIPVISSCYIYNLAVT